MKLELGCGVHPTDGYLHHDREAHSEYVDAAWDLERFPWPWADGQFSEVLAIDVFEHLRVEVDTWLDECWRILEPRGTLRMRLPAWNNPLSWRDPTHHRVFHEQTFNYWDPETVEWRDFGRLYYSTLRWWTVVNVSIENDDFRYVLVKVGEPYYGGDVDATA